jgi:hypothetical protein
MSGYTLTQPELYYTYDQAATISVVSASAVTITATYPVCEIYGGWFSTLGAKSTSLKLKMGGLITATATVPSFVFSLYLSTTNAFAATTLLVAGAANTPSAAANAWWNMDVDIALRALAPGAAATISAHGEIRSPVFASPFMVSMPAAGAYSPLAAYSADANAYLWPTLTLGAATAGNQVTTQYMKLYGEN